LEISVEFQARQQLRAQIRQTIEPTIARLGCRLTGVELASDTSGPILRLYVDRAGGVSVGVCAKVSREVSPLLEALDPLPGAYNLEVSSPGVDRLLELPEDFARFAGFRVRLKLDPTGEAAGRKRATGKLIGLDGDDVVFAVVAETPPKGVAAGPAPVERVPLSQVGAVRLYPTPEEFEQLRALAVAELSTLDVSTDDDSSADDSSPDSTDDSPEE
jgi:ribosome maturation factor RimP